MAAISSVVRQHSNLPPLPSVNLIYSSSPPQFYVNNGCETSSDGSCSTHGSSGCNNSNSNSMPVNQCNSSGTNGTCSSCGASS
ncbi:hypothetical protein I302_102247 [Kwoniella bestiolae CBS 10118]|uniref:Uncharacterized protein n=1 Tax=Kwoniella bestiolae CBS 10118 TaxID=1296100 RepID=A0A1B9GEN8_9TREE|nr:hypothetical protein I302_00936 [Kwoniella bestiolae CBS 10118]OCF29431.1 hypothetical protein I302_00936 [Kwoniella bestiolae CBS 10118]